MSVCVVAQPAEFNLCFSRHITLRLVIASVISDRLKEEQHCSEYYRKTHIMICKVMTFNLSELCSKDIGTLPCPL